MINTLMKRFDYFEKLVNPLLAPAPQAAPKLKSKVESMVLTNSDTNYLMAQLRAGKQLRLLYRMSRDGVMNIDFHKRCDHKGPTVTLFKTSTGRRCGGYISVSWEHISDGWKADSSAFLISFDNQQRFNVKNSQQAI